MKRIDIVYGSRQYSIGGRDYEDVKAEIVQGMSSETPTWLVVNDGEGHQRPAHLLLARGIDVAVIPIPGDD